ncbi:MAG: PEP-CTERM sorting domain-containing protein [Planctomycetota bacterium]
MKTALLSIALALCVCSPACRADFIVGSVGFSFETDPFDSTLGMDAEREITSVKTTNARSGFFSQAGGFPSGTDWATFTVPDFASSDKSLTISNADFGTFTATVINDVLIQLPGLSQPTGRNMSLLGTWLPGTNSRFTGFTDPVVAELSLTLITTSTMKNSVVSGAMVFAAHGAAVPEPGSLLLLGAVSIAVPLRRRLKRRSAPQSAAAVS